MRKVTEKELQENHTIIIHENPFVPLSSAEAPDEVVKKFAYFKSAGDLNIFIRGKNIQEDYRLPLNSSNYGFSPERKINIQPYSPKIDFAPPAEEKITHLLSQKTTSLNQALEDLTYAVNRSIVYNLNNVFNSNGFSQKVKDLLKNCHYTPYGDETISGICSDAGYQIRKLLLKIIDDATLRFTTAIFRSSKTECNHDTTIVFDTISAEWVILNSKSPLKTYNLVPKEKISDLGFSV